MDPNRWKNSELERTKLKQQMIAEVLMYWNIFNKPIQLKALSAKYNKRAKPLGGFRTLIDELQGSGLISYTMEESGRMLVFPAGAPLGAPLPREEVK